MANTAPLKLGTTSGRDSRSIGIRWCLEPLIHQNMISDADQDLNAFQLMAMDGSIISPIRLILLASIRGWRSADMLIKIIEMDLIGMFGDMIHCEASQQRKWRSPEW
jgi:hypothetical protein